MNDVELNNSDQSPTSVVGRPSRNAFLNRASAFGGFAILIVIWQAVVSFGLVHSALIPSAATTFLRLLDLIVSGSALPDVYATLKTVLVGFLAAAMAGTILGLAMGSFPILYQSLTPAVDFFRSVPVTTLYPVFVLSAGIDALSKIAMVFTACVWIIMLNSAYGVLHASPVRAQMARLYGASRLQVFVLVRAFDALPQTVIGLRVAISYAMIVCILCEMFMGAKYGIGQRIMEAYTTYAMTDLYALILLAGTIGFVLNHIFVLVERRLVHWSGR